MSAAHVSSSAWALFLFAGLLVWALALLSWRQRSNAPAAGWLALTLLAMGQVLVFYGASYAGGLSLEVRLAAIDLTYLGWVLAPPAFLFYIARLTQLDSWLSKPIIAVIAVVSLGFGVLILGPWGEQLFFSGGRDLQSFDFSASATYWAFTLWSYVLIVTALALTAISAARSPRLHRSQVALVYVTLALPLVLSLFGAQNIKFFGVDPTVLSLLIVAFTAYAISHFRSFDLRPLTQAEQQLASNRGVVVVDSYGRLTQMNAAAAQLLGPFDDAILGQDIERIWSQTPAIVAGLRGADLAGIAAVTGSSEQALTFERSPIIEPSGQRSGTLVFIEPADSHQSDTSITTGTSDA